MYSKSETLTENKKSIHWQTIIIVALASFYLSSIGFKIVNTRTQLYSADILAFWSVGKIADEYGYSHIYDLEKLKVFQAQVMSELGLLGQNELQKFKPTAVPYLSIFIFPFQFLSRLEIHTASLVWLILNLIVLIGYLLFFFRHLQAESGIKKQRVYALLLVLISYPVFDNCWEGQINVLLMICVGEFIRNASLRKPVIAGVWLGGLLLKPQLLILIVPIFLFLRYWKVLAGFLISSFVFISSSWVLSRTQGMAQLITLLSKYSTGMTTNSTDIMINWRMIGINLNSLSHSSLGWVIAALGMLGTLMAVIYLVAQKPAFGSATWMFMTLGIFSATLAFTWHAHNHMAMVLVPLLLTTSVSGRLPLKILDIWSLIPPIVWIGLSLIVVTIPFVADQMSFNYLGFTFVISRFLVNLIILIYVVIHIKDVLVTPKAMEVNSS